MWMRITSVDPSLPTRSPVPASSANTTGLPASVVSCVSSAAVSTSTIDVSRSAGTSLPNVTFATPVVSVRLSVESVSFAAGGTWSRLRVARNPSSSTVRLVVDTTLGTESAATVTVSVEDEVSPSWSVIV